MWTFRPLFAVSSILAALAIACSMPGRAPKAIVVYAAASLAAAVEEAGDRFSGLSGVKVEVRPGGSGALAQGILHGAPADVFISAHPQWVDRLASEGSVDPTTRTTIARNRLAIVVPIGSATSMTSLDGVADLGRIAIGDPESVPAGSYARDALTAAGLWDAVAPKAALAGDVRQALAWAERGEVDAAIVYASDARSSQNVWIAYEVDPALHPPILCEAVLTRRGAGRKEAHQLLKFLQDTEAREVLARNGFLAPAPR